MVMFGAAFAAGIGCTVALSNLGPKHAAPNPWAPDAPKAVSTNSRSVGTNAGHAATPRAAAPAAKLAVAAPEATKPVAQAPAEQVRIIGGGRVTPAPERSSPPIVARDDSADTSTRSTETAKRNAPMPLNDYEREALARQAAAKANSELAGAPARSGASPQVTATTTSPSFDDDAADTKRAQQEAADKARAAKARKAARERQLARARQQDYDYNSRRYDDGYRGGRDYAQDYRGGGYGGGNGGFFRPGGIW